jgi:hypothetical protein
MSDPPEANEASEVSEATEPPESEAVRALVKRALAKGTLAKNPPDILRGVQRRIRARSRGKFFADGWSTAQGRPLYILIALITLLVVGLAYYALMPMDVH